MRGFLDSNIVLYAAGQRHPQRDTRASFLRRVAEGVLDATTNSEVIQEILNAPVRRGRGRDGVALARHVAALFLDVLPVTGEDMRRAGFVVSLPVTSDISETRRV